MKTLTSIIFASLAALSGSAHAEHYKPQTYTWARTASGALGCEQYLTGVQFDFIAMSRDNLALLKMLKEHAKDCTPVDINTRVWIMDKETVYGSFYVRKEGETKALWLDPATEFKPE